MGKSRFSGGHLPDHAKASTDSPEAATAAQSMQAANHRPAWIKASHARLSAMTGLSGDDLRLSKHRLIECEIRAGYTAAPWKVFSLDLEMVIALRRIGFPMGLSTKPAPHTCQARTRRGTPCKARALKNGRCRLHGGMSTGPRSAEGWERTRAGYRAWLERRRGADG